MAGTGNQRSPIHPADSRRLAARDRRAVRRLSCLLRPARHRLWRRRRPIGAPRASVARYAAALQPRGRRDSAWRDARRRRPARPHRPRSTAALMTSNAAELRVQGEALARARRRPDVHRRTRPHRSSRAARSIVLVLEEDGWRIDGGVLDAAGLATPAGRRRRLPPRPDAPRPAVASSACSAGRRAPNGRRRSAAWSTSTEDPEDLEIDIQGNTRPRPHHRWRARSIWSASPASGGSSTSSARSPVRRIEKRRRPSRVPAASAWGQPH